MDAPNVVLIVLDAVRPDHLSCYGYGRETTPNIDRFAAEGVRYTNAFSNSNYTGEAHPPIFTGRLPSQIGAYGDDPSLPADTKVLTERLSEAGYRTFGTSAGAHIRRDRGYDRGFDVFRETHRIRPDREAAGKLLREPPYRKQVLFSLTRGPDDKTLYKFESLKRFVDAGDGPFFAFLNCKTAHYPYNPPRPYKSMYCPDLRRPRYEIIEQLYDAIGQQPQRLSGVDMELCRTEPGSFMTDAYDPTDEEWDTIKAWYDGAISYLDSRIGAFVEALDARDELDNTYLILTADHGEMFGEHGLTQHKYSLYDTLLRVPLVIRPPKPTRGVEIDARASLIDLFATVLDIADVKIPERRHSASLLPFDDVTQHEYTFAEIGNKGTAALERRHPDWTPPAFQVGPLQSIRNDEFKLIASLEDEVELYRWREDRSETTDLLAEHPEVVDSLLTTLRRETGEMRTTAATERAESEALKRTLEHLGYR